MRYICIVYKLHTTLGDIGQYNKRLTQCVELSHGKPHFADLYKKDIYKYTMKL